MTNKDKFLKDEVSTREFIQSFSKWYYKQERQIKNVDTLVAEFIQEPIAPTLTEDERVILRNIDKDFINIGRTTKGSLYVQNEFQDVFDSIDIYYNHLFQFIKERRRIRDKGVIEKWRELIYI